MTVNYSNIIHFVQILDTSNGLNRLELGWALVGLKINTYMLYIQWQKCKLSSSQYSSKNPNYFQSFN